MKIETLDSWKIPEGIRIPYIGGKWYSFISRLEQKAIVNLSVSDFELNKTQRNEKIIVSLTSFPVRIEVAAYTIKSLFNQTMKPDRIILWLAESQFLSHKLPVSIEELCEIGLEVRFVDDLKSHKKYYYALKEQEREELVITYDDDIIYPEDSVERLYNIHKKYPDCIVCNRAAAVSVIKDSLGPYSTWKVHSDIGVNSPSSLLFPSTGGGTLYPYGSVGEEVFNIDQMKKLAFSADDLWVRFMSALKKTKIVKTRKNHRTFTVLEGSQNESLQMVNCLQAGNDKTIRRLSSVYPEALENIIYGDK